MHAAGYTVHTPYVSLDTPGKATVQVVILQDPDGHEVSRTILCGTVVNSVWLVSNNSLWQLAMLAESMMHSRPCGLMNVRVVCFRDAPVV